MQTTSVFKYAILFPVGTTTGVPILGNFKMENAVETKPSKGNGSGEMYFSPGVHIYIHVDDNDVNLSQGVYTVSDCEKMYAVVVYIFNNFFENESKIKINEVNIQACFNVGTTFHWLGGTLYLSTGWQLCLLTEFPKI